jgi:hypothetical protein
LNVEFAWTLIHRHVLESILVVVEQREISGPGSIPGHVVGRFIEMIVLGYDWRRATPAAG